MNNNLVFLEGYLLAKPELKIAKDGSKKYCNCGISVKGRKKILETGYYDRTIFNFTAFGKNAERLCDFCDKGTRINLFGELSMNKYTTQENVVNERGVVESKEKKHSFIQINCTDFTILSKMQKDALNDEAEEKRIEESNKEEMESISSQIEEEYYEENKLSPKEDSDMFYDDLFDDKIPF